MQLSKSRLILIVGDVLALALVTFYGLSEHDLLSNKGDGFMRTFLPWLVAWIIMGYFANLFEVDSKGVYSQILKPLLGMVLVSPLAGLLRGFYLGANVVPIFVVVFGGFSAIAVAVWRLIYFSVVKNRLANG